MPHPLHLLSIDIKAAHVAWQPQTPQELIEALQAERGVQYKIDPISPGCMAPLLRPDGKWGVMEAKGFVLYAVYPSRRTKIILSGVSYDEAWARIVGLMQPGRPSGGHLWS